MADKKDRTHHTSETLGKTLQGVVSWRTISGFFIGVATLVGMIMLIHSEIYSHLVQNPTYTVRLDQFVETNYPSWAQNTVKQDINTTVAREGAINRVDRNYEKQIRKAYRSSPWVRSVEKVTNHRNGIQVHLKLRRPVAIVVTPEGNVLVDETGTRLPGTYGDVPDEFSDLPRTESLEQTGPEPGMTWNSPRIKAVSETAGYLRRTSIHHEIALKEIELEGSDLAWQTGRGELVFKSAGGHRVIWGRSASQAGPGEPEPERKLQNLFKILRAAPGLTGIQAVNLTFQRPVIKPMKSVSESDGDRNPLQ